MAASHSLKLSVFPHYAPPLRKNSKAFCEPKFGSVNTSARWKLRPQSLKFWSQNKRLVCRSKSIVSAAVGEEEDENEEDESSFEEPEKVQTPEPERDFSGTPYIPVYVMLPLGIINHQCQLVDPESLQKYLTTLKFAHVDGVMVDCWWGIVEGEGPQKYNWSGYRELFDIVCKLKLKLQVVMSLHECGGNVGDDVSITLPNWILVWRCSAGDTLPHSHRFSIDMSKKFSISNSNNFLYFNCNRSSVLVQPPFGNCDSCSMCDTTHYLCTHLPDCPKPLPHASCCSYYPRTSDSFRLMLENCESYASIYWDAYNQNPGYGIRLNYEIPITSECQNCQREVDGTCGYHTQFATFLCLCTHNNVTTHCTEYSHLHHLSQGRVLAGIISSIIIGGMIFTGVIIWYLRRTRANRPLRLGVVNNNT